LTLRTPRFIQRLFVDPLSVKELSGIARRWQTYVGRGLYVGLIGFIIWIFWLNLSRRGDWMSPSAYAELGRGLFFSFFALQMVVVTFGGMSSSSDMITREIRGGTLGLLALTPLTSWRIVAGKWKASLLQTSTAILCGGPVFSVCVYLGGAGPWEFAYSLTLSLVSAALGAAVALYCSTIFRAGYVVTIVSFIALLVYCIAPVVLLAGTNGDNAVMTFLVYTHPLYAAIGAAMESSASSVPWARWTYGWLGASLTTAVLITVLLRAAASRVRMLIRRPGGNAPPVPSLDDLRKGPLVAEPRTSKLGRFLRGRQGVWEHHAILWKELSTRRVGVGNAARLGGALLVFALLTTLPAEGWWRVLVLWFSSFVLVLVALANGVSLFVTEREERKWDVLLTTPLRASEIVAAKLLAGLSGLAPMAAILAFFWMLMGYAFGVSLPSALMTMGSLGLMTLFSYVLAAFMSLNARHQRAAFSSAFGLLIAVLFVLPALAFMLQSNHVVLGRTEFADTLVGCSNPGTYLAHVSDPLSRSYRWEGWQEARRVRESQLVPMFFIYSGIYSTMIVGLVLWMIHRFDRLAGRS
jgi:ABC-type transport system involved in multi-copper enzyme maturation permease subunit